MSTDKNKAESPEVIPSLMMQVLGLATGKSISLAERIDGDLISKGDIRSAREKLRNLATTAVNRAKRHIAGAEYTVEGGEITTRSLDTLVVVAITRTT